MRQKQVEIVSYFPNKTGEGRETVKREKNKILLKHFSNLSFLHNNHKKRIIIRLCAVGFLFNVSLPFICIFLNIQTLQQKIRSHLYYFYITIVYET